MPTAQGSMPTAQESSGLKRRKVQILKTELDSAYVVRMLRL